MRLVMFRIAALLLPLLSGCGSNQPAAPSHAVPSHAAPSHAAVNATRPLAARSALAATASTAPVASAAPLASAQPAATSAPHAPPKPLNVIVITIDSMRADMPWAGYPLDIAPRLTAFSKQSVSYSRAYSLSSYTAMSMAGFLAGRYPGELQRSGYFFSAHPPEETFFPEILSSAGVRTLSAQAHFYFEHKSGLQQGFADWQLVPGLSADNSTDKNVTSPQHLALAEKMLGTPANSGGQFFAWFHFMDPHDQYMRHDGVPDFGPKMRNRYDGEIFFADKHVGQLLDYIDNQPWGKHTAVLISADHGEAFGEHKMSRHGFELWEPLVRVPLMMRIPGIAAQQIDTPRSHIDLAPTIFELLGQQIPPQFHGKSLLADVQPGTTVEARDVIVDLPRTSDNRRRRAMVSGDYKLIAFGDDFRFELYNVVTDPGETVDLRSRDKTRYQELKARYLERVKTIQDICPKMRSKLLGKRPGAKC